MGAAIADFHRRGKAQPLRVFSSRFDEDEMPVKELFRTFDTMPPLEQTALRMAQGRILDVGAGSGCHSLALQAMGKDVCAIDISPLSVEVMRERGVKPENTYLFGTGEKEVLSPLRKTKAALEIVRTVTEDAGHGRKTLLVTAKNVGERAALDAGAQLAGEGYALLGTDSDRILFPGEERTFAFLAIPKHCGGFAETQNRTDEKAGTAEVILHWL